MEKIKRNIIVASYWLLVAGLLFYTRFVGLDWGLPYPMHPDERNMAVSVANINCEIKNPEFEIQNCFHPHFFAYGQLPLYLAYLLIWIGRGFSNFGKMVISFEEATLALRVISAMALILSAIIVIKVIKVITGIKKEKIWWWLMVIFSPFFIQFSHFGTTEALLMFFYLLLIYLGLLFSDQKIDLLYFLKVSAIVSGLALATKVSSLIFLVLPLLIIFFISKKTFVKKIFLLGYFFSLSLIVAVIFSPHNFISWPDFYSTFKYERAVALGEIKTFYTKQFDYSLPIVFQLIKVIPAAMGFVSLISFIGFIRFIGKKKKDKKIIFLFGAFLIYFLPNAVIYAKWTRFLAPVFPIILIFGIIFLEKIKVIKVIKIIIVILGILPGIAYLLIYQNPDIRFQASEWIFKNIPENSYILSETANVIDIPIISQKLPSDSEGKSQKLLEKNLQIISFNFYDLDQNETLQKDLIYHLNRADYIFVPSRRIFANYTCFWPEKRNNFLDNLSYEKNRCDKLKKEFPKLNQYYQNLFSGRLGFEKVAEFSSSPKISFFGKRLFEFSDEQTEETWTVFDHPVIRVYKRK
jgi:hypothetical protein